MYGKPLKDLHLEIALGLKVYPNDGSEYFLGCYDLTDSVTTITFANFDEMLEQVIDSDKPIFTTCISPAWLAAIERENNHGQ